MRLLVAAFLLVAEFTMAAEIVLIYPRREAGQDTFRYSTSLDSTFVLGRVDGAGRGDTFLCNGISVNLTPDGAFLAFLPLQKAPETSSWNFALIQGGTDTSKLEFPYGWMDVRAASDWESFETPLLHAIAVPNAHTRTDIGGSYHLFPFEGTELKILGSSDDWALFEICPGFTGVVEKRFLKQEFSTLGNASHQTRIQNGTASTRDLNVNLSFGIDRLPLWEANMPSPESFCVTLHNTVAYIDRIHFLGKSREFIDDVTWTQNPASVELQISTSTNGWRGFSLTATDSTLNLELIRSQNAKPGLRGKRIVIDPGHGGGADGAIGPRGTKEKDVVLLWSSILGKELNSQGASVAFTRTGDISLGLYERIAVAREFECDAFLSLHANALPDGENPAFRRGCGTYYYHSMSRPLAEFIQDGILERTGLNDDGIFDANFAVVRPTDFPAVLIESAYLIHPDEELLLLDEKFLKQVSAGIRHGLEEFFSEAYAR